VSAAEGPLVGSRRNDQDSQIIKIPAQRSAATTATFENPVGAALLFADSALWNVSLPLGQVMMIPLC
jgi:hypothetical protein